MKSQVWVPSSYLCRVRQHCYRWHGAGSQGHGNGQGCQRATPGQKVPRTLFPPVHPGKVHPNAGGRPQHEGKHHVICYSKRIGLLLMDWHLFFYSQFWSFYLSFPKSLLSFPPFWGWGVVSSPSSSSLCRNSLFRVGWHYSRMNIGGIITVP